MAIVLMEIDIISNEQMKIVKYNEELEDRRLTLMEFIQRGEHLKITSGAKANLIKNVTEMKLMCQNLELLKTVEFKGGKNADITMKDIVNISKSLNSNILHKFVKNSKRMENVKVDQVASIGCKRDKACQYMRINNPSKLLKEKSAK